MLNLCSHQVLAPECFLGPLFFDQLKGSEQLEPVREGPASAPPPSVSGGSPWRMYVSLHLHQLSGPLPAPSPCDCPSHLLCSGLPSPVPPATWTSPIPPQERLVWELEHREPAALAAQRHTELKIECGTVGDSGGGGSPGMNSTQENLAKLRQLLSHLPAVLSAYPRNLKASLLQFVSLSRISPPGVWTKPMAHQHILLNKLLELV